MPEPLGLAGDVVREGTARGANGVLSNQRKAKLVAEKRDARGDGRDGEVHARQP